MLDRLALAATALLVAGPALAGGFAQPAATPVPAAPAVAPIIPVIASDWTGFYAGGQLGFGAATFDPVSEGEEDRYDGALYGVHAGYMFDFGRIVAGAEIDFDATGISQTPFGPGAPSDIDSIARAKLRLGYDAGRFLPYVTAGLARASFSSEEDEAAVFLDGTYEGSFAGLGVAYAVSDRLVVSAEALRHDFDLGDADDEMSGEVNTVTLRGSFRF